MQELEFRVIPYGGAQYESMVAIRQEVLRTPLGMVLQPEELERDRNDILICGFLAAKMCSSSILKIESKTLCRFRQIAVKTEYQNGGIGRKAIEFIENFARKKWFLDAFLNARIDAVPFYEKLGYHVVGESFIEVTRPHIRMEKRL